MLNLGKLRPYLQIMQTSTSAWFAYQGTLTEGEGSLNVDLLVKVACFCKKKSCLQFQKQLISAGKESTVLSLPFSEGSLA